MEEEIYLTPNLIIMDMKSYYINDDTNKLEKINVKNWHKYYSEYGWEKIDNGWIRRFNLNKLKKETNTRWGVLDCGGNGDCLFYTIAEAYKYIEPEMDVNYL